MTNEKTVSCPKLEDVPRVESTKLDKEKVGFKTDQGMEEKEEEEVKLFNQGSAKTVNKFLFVKNESKPHLFIREFLYHPCPELSKFIDRYPTNILSIDKSEYVFHKFTDQFMKNEHKHEFHNLIQRYQMKTLMDYL